MLESMPFVGLSLWEIIVTVCNTLITFLLVKKFLFKPVRKMMAAREEEVQAMYTVAQQNQQEAEQLRAEYTQHLAHAKEEAATITQGATKRANAQSEEILKAASKNASEMMQKAEAAIEQERKKAMNEIKDEIGGLSIMIASKVVEKDINEADHKRLIEDFIDKVG